MEELLSVLDADSKSLNINALTRDKKNALMLLYDRTEELDNNVQSSNSRVAIVELLVRYGIDVNHYYNGDGSHALLLLCMHDSRATGFVHVLTAMLERGAEVNRRNANDWTALLYLAKHYAGSELNDIVELLLQHEKQELPAENRYKYYSDVYFSLVNRRSNSIRPAVLELLHDKLMNANHTGP